MKNIREKQKIFNKNDEIFFHRCLFGWLLSTYIVGYVVLYFNIPVNDISILNTFSKITPAINIWTDMHYETHVAKATWLYVTYTGPVLLLFLFFRIKAKVINISNSSLIFSTTFLLIIGYFLTEMCVFGKVFGKEVAPSNVDYNNMMAKLEFIFKTESGAISLAAFSGFSIVGLYFSFFAYHVALIRKYLNK